MSTPVQEMSSSLFGELAYCEICKRLQVVAPVRLVVRYALSESLHSCLTEWLGLPVCLQVVARDEIVLGAQYPAYGIEEFGHKLLPLSVKLF